MDDLIKRIESAPRGGFDELEGRELDGEIALLLGWERHGKGWAHWTSPDGSTNQHVPFFTLSLDAAWTSIPEGVVHIRLYIEGPASDLKEGLTEAQLWMDEDGDLIHKGYKATTALAVLLAALRAINDSNV